MFCDMHKQIREMLDLREKFLNAEMDRINGAKKYSISDASSRMKDYKELISYKEL